MMARMPRVLVSLFALIVPLTVVAAGHDLSTSTTQQLSPVVTGNSPGFAVAWIDQSPNRPGIGASRVSNTGDPLDGPGITLAQTSTHSLAIAQSPSETLTVWSTNGGIFAARLTPSGVLLDSTPIVIALQFVDEVAVDWDGSRYFVVWSSGPRLFGSLVGSDGTVTPPRQILDRWNVATSVLSPDATWNGHEHVVVFAESPPAQANCTCPPPPDHVSVMRVSAEGDAIDAIPLRIQGLHTRAHVASSGAESLIVMDDGGHTSSMIVREVSGTLHLDAEVPLFHWFYPVSSDVAWNGSSYTVGWRYPGTPSGPSWLASTRVTSTGVPSETLFTTVGSPDFSNDSPSWGPSVAANGAGEIAFVVAELALPSSVSRGRLYLMSEMQPSPAAPPAPRNVISYFGGNTARIDWQSESAEGFLLEWSYDFGNTWNYYTTLPADARTTTQRAYVGNLFRVSAFGPGGMSAGTITSIGSQQRRHSARQ